MFTRMSVAIALFLFAGTAMADMTPISEVKSGQSVIVQGVVDRILDGDEIRLRDDTGTLRVYLGPQSVPLRTGERVVIRGVMDDGLVMNEFYARKITRENGDRISVSHSYE